MAEKSLIERFNNKEGAAFKTIYSMYQPDLLGQIQKMSNGSVDPADFIQIAFTKLWTSNIRFDAPENIRQFLYQTVKNQYLDFQKHEAVKMGKSEDIARQTATVDADYREEQEKREQISHFINRAIEKLPEPYREIFELSFLDHYSDQEVADRMKIKKKTVYNKKGILVEQLIDYVNKKGGRETLISNFIL